MIGTLLDSRIQKITIELERMIIIDGINPPEKQSYSTLNQKFAAGETQLYFELMSLRPRMAEAAQNVYNAWTQDENGEDEELGGGGICDGIASAIEEVIINGIGDVITDPYGHDGDEHAAIVASRMGSNEGMYLVDIPYSIYETGGGYNWKKIPDVTFGAWHVVIQKL